MLKDLVDSINHDVAQFESRLQDLQAIKDFLDKVQRHHRPVETKSSSSLQHTFGKAASKISRHADKCSSCDIEGGFEFESWVANRWIYGHLYTMMHNDDAEEYNVAITMLCSAIYGMYNYYENQQHQRHGMLLQDGTEFVIEIFNAIAATLPVASASAIITPGNLVDEYMHKFCMSSCSSNDDNDDKDGDEKGAKVADALLRDVTRQFIHLAQSGGE